MMADLRFPDTDRRRGGYALVTILVVVSVILMTVYYREGDDGLLHSARRVTHAATAPVAAFGDWVTTPVRAARDWGSGLSVSRSEITSLREQNDELRLKVVELEEARLENERLKSLVGFIDARELEALGARVIGRPTTAWEGVITIDRGTSDGVTTGMPVLAPEGLLGQTVDVTEHSAKVRLITDQRSGVSAIIQATRAEGIVSGSIEQDLTMDFVSQESTVVVGDIVLTSGMGGVYPKGLLIGDVELVEVNENDLFQSISVRPAADVVGIEEVIVLAGTPPETDAGSAE
jgi:rod shape-determining protein MreC